MKLKSFVAVAIVAASAAVASPAAADPVAQERATCKDGGWEHVSGMRGGQAFANQGLCVSHVSTGGTLYHAAS